jgi:hypothetical protein
VIIQQLVAKWTIEDFEEIQQTQPNKTKQDYQTRGQKRRDEAKVSEEPPIKKRDRSRSLESVSNLRRIEEEEQARLTNKAKKTSAVNIDSLQKEVVEQAIDNSKDNKVTVKKGEKTAMADGNKQAKITAADKGSSLKKVADPYSSMVNACVNIPALLGGDSSTENKTARIVKTVGKGRNSRQGHMKARLNQKVIKQKQLSPSKIEKREETPLKSKQEIKVLTTAVAKKTSKRCIKRKVKESLKQFSQPEPLETPIKESKPSKFNVNNCNYGIINEISLENLSPVQDKTGLDNVAVAKLSRGSFGSPSKRANSPTKGMASKPEDASPGKKPISPDKKNVRNRSPKEESREIREQETRAAV